MTSIYHRIKCEIFIYIYIYIFISISNVRVAQLAKVTDTQEI